MTRWNVELIDGPTTRSGTNSMSSMGLITTPMRVYDGRDASGQAYELAVRKKR